MKKTDNSAKSNFTYLQVFQLIFVFFFLYLVKDALYRWDGFKINASFLDFIPSIALTSILWSIIALITATLIWLLLRMFVWACMRIGWKVRVEYVYNFVGFFVLLAVIFWVGKKIILSDAPIFPILEGILLFSMFIGAILLTWIFRDKPDMVHERITPLLWLFGAITILSFPIVIYHTWLRQGDNVVIQETIHSTGDEVKPNIILLTFDALTTRDMSVYGYHRPTTPFINEWSKNATLFTRAYAGSNMTDPTTTSLMTGKRVWTHRTYHNINAGKSKDRATENLGVAMKKNGYRTLSLNSNGLANVEFLGIANGFDFSARWVDLMNPHGLYKFNSFIKRLFENKILFYDWILQEDFILRSFINLISGDYNETIYPVNLTFNKFLASIEDVPQTPFFAWIHLYPPHSPYLAPAPYMGMFDPSQELRTFKPQYDIIKRSEFEGGYIIEKDAKYVDTLKARYDEFIRYCDKGFEQFIEQLQSRKLLENTIIIVSADHGESFDHNYLLHGSLNLFESVTSIPLIIKEPGQIEGKVIHALIEQIDIPATILELANSNVPSWMEGHSLVPLLRSNEHLSRPIFSMAFYENPSDGHITKGSVAVWEDEYKLIHYLESNTSLLFNLRQDPEEINNLIDKEPGAGEHLLGIIRENLKKVNDRNLKR